MARADLFRCASHQCTRTHRGQHIFEIVRSLQRNLGDGENGLQRSIPSKNNLAVANECSRFHFALAAEPEHLGASTSGKFNAGGIVRIEHGEIVRLLILKDARLGVDVSRKCPMAIEVVGSHVEHDRNFGAKAGDRFQLKTRNLQNNHGFRRGLVGQ